MPARAHTPAARRRGSPSKAGLRLVVFHASPDVRMHVAPLTRSRRFTVSCHPQQRLLQRSRRPRRADAVLWEIAPGRRPNWRQLKAMAPDGPIVSYSAGEDADAAARSRAMGFSCHLAAPLNIIEIEYQIALTSSVDLATRLRQSQLLRRYLARVEVFNEMHRAVNASLEPSQVAAALASRVASWLPVGWAVVGRSATGVPIVLAEHGVAGNAEMAVRVLGAWVLDRSRIYSAASLQADPVIVDAPDAAAIALPLTCRGQTIAALVGVDHGPSPRPPRLPASLAAVWRHVLEPAAYALENAFRMQRAEALSVTDDLTQLHNSRFLAQALRGESKRAVRSRQPLSLLFLDLDGFKGVNDQHGHLFGSRALVEVALIIRDCSRETDIASRFGGDEFAVVLPDTGTVGALAVARRICDRVREHVFLKSAGIDYRLTASVGVATMLEGVGSVDELLQAADDAMYMVKAHGKDGVQLAGMPAKAAAVSSNLREDRSA